jgi:hypothetical protein
MEMMLRICTGRRWEGVAKEAEQGNKFDKSLTIN